MVLVSELDSNLKHNPVVADGNDDDDNNSTRYVRGVTALSSAPFTLVSDDYYYCVLLSVYSHQCDVEVQGFIYIYIYIIAYSSTAGSALAQASSYYPFMREPDNHRKRLIVSNK